ncbi:hypothetical protein PIB30_050523 [Stylosanthes scabra]|uniref:Uncharacterized protein n=1 Tax=Stylosanthes scabra TaxID=79078 RepID=A0ABU6UHZ9_9FABA|nr:hypothetical protein [Stylosanthes scabra]
MTVLPTIPLPPFRCNARRLSVLNAQRSTLNCSLLPDTYFQNRHNSLMHSPVASQRSLLQTATTPSPQSTEFCNGMEDRLATKTKIKASAVASDGPEAMEVGSTVATAVSLFSKLSAVARAASINIS